MKVLTTGFTAFPGVRVNPTEHLIEDFKRNPPSLAGDPATFYFEVLPTEYDRAGQQIERLLFVHKPDALLLLGVGGNRNRLSLERFALNVDDAVSPDASGTLRQGKKIDPSASVAHQTPINLDCMRNHLLSAGIDAEVSNHAGTYVCNHVYFVSMEAVRRHALPTKAVFVHVPPLNTITAHQAAIHVLRRQILVILDALTCIS